MQTWKYAEKLNHKMIFRLADLPTFFVVGGDGLVKIKNLTVSKHYLLRSQLKAILRYHVEDHQEWLFNLEIDHPYFYFSPNQILLSSKVTSNLSRPVKSILVRFSLTNLDICGRREKICFIWIFLMRQFAFKMVGNYHIRPPAPIALDN